MKQLSKDPTSRSRALKAEARANEKSGASVSAITIKPIGEYHLSSPDLPSCPPPRNYLKRREGPNLRCGTWEVGWGVDGKASYNAQQTH